MANKDIRKVRKTRGEAPASSVQEIPSIPVLKPRSDKQKFLMDEVENKSVIIITGYPGSAKTFIPTVMACQAYANKTINNIYLVRPFVSKSKSPGFYAGTLEEKASNWLGEVLSVMKEHLGTVRLEEGIKNGDIQFIPLEVIKGRSLKDCFVLCEEAEDITIEEARKIVTRIGQNCTMVLSGDIAQTDLKEESGLRFLKNIVETNDKLKKITGIVDFNSPDDIVRSKECKLWTLALEEAFKNNVK